MAQRARNVGAAQDGCIVVGLRHLARASNEGGDGQKKEERQPFPAGQLAHSIGSGLCAWGEKRARKTVAQSPGYCQRVQNCPFILGNSYIC
jgi:hypothetical protein